MTGGLAISGRDRSVHQLMRANCARKKLLKMAQLLSAQNLPIKFYREHGIGALTISVKRRIL
jgi:hypothetical protein